MSLNPEHLRISVENRNARPGGQCAVDTPRGVRVEHLPTGLSAYCDTSLSQIKNKNIACCMVEYGLAEAGWGK